MKKMTEYNKLSKEISYALRHAPWEYELELDDHGWVLIDQLLNSLNQNSDYEKINTNDLIKMIDKSDKKRHEIKNNSIRAMYGHSLPMKIVKEVSRPPKILYHGTSHESLKTIKLNGLLPMLRQYVHLSEDIRTATLVGKRKDEIPILLTINTELAEEDGVVFYLGNEKVWLSNAIPPKFISVNKK